MDRRPIVIFDSGVGGLSYLELAVKRLPKEQFIYLADNKSYPYGEKSKESIIKAVCDAIEKIILKVNPKCVVIACNTASVVALSHLRRRFSIPFIGVVPAVKPAAMNTQKKKIGVIATLRTTLDNYLHDLISDFAEGCDVSIVPAGNIRDMVEQHFFTSTRCEREKVLREVVKELQEVGVDFIVLGCTHFLLLEDEFKNILGKDIKLIDSREGVINQLIRILDKYNLKSTFKEGENYFYITGNLKKNNQYKSFSDKFGLIFSGNL